MMRKKMFGLFALPMLVAASVLEATIATTTIITRRAGARQRHLSQEKFLSYEPITTVTDDAAIDLDQKLLMELLAKGTSQGRMEALDVYTKGAFSKSYATLKLDQALNLPLFVPKGTELTGMTKDGKEVRGTLLNDARRGNLTIDFRYHASTVQSEWTKCHVGGNPDPFLEGCLAPGGSVNIDGYGDFAYTYLPDKENYNARNFQYWSIKAREKMYDCPKDGCPYPTFKQFYDYYGQADYANRWILAAFTHQPTKMTKGNADFSQYEAKNEIHQEGINEAISKATVLLNTWMYVNKQIEHASFNCDVSALCAIGNDDCQIEKKDDAMHAWDKAVAFYVGGEPKMSGHGGYLLYTLAQKRCTNFGTCLTTTKEVGMADVNSRLMKAFRSGQQLLLANDCGKVAEQVDYITQLMIIPIVQGVLRYAYHQDNISPKEAKPFKTEAEGATYAAALLPLIHHCDPTYADILYNNMRIGNNGTTDFKVVKHALETNYACLGITCEDVGGLIDVVAENEEGVSPYMPGAEPCGYQGATSSSSSNSDSSSNDDGSSSDDDDKANVGLAVGLSIAIVGVFMIVAVIVSHKGKNSKAPTAASEHTEETATPPPSPVMDSELT